MQKSKNDAIQLLYILEESALLRNRFEIIRQITYKINFLTDNDVGISWLDMMNSILKFETSVQKEIESRVSADELCFFKKQIENEKIDDEKDKS